MLLMPRYIFRELVVVSMPRFLEGTGHCSLYAPLAIIGRGKTAPLGRLPAKCHTRNNGWTPDYLYAHAGSGIPFRSVTPDTRESNTYAKAEEAIPQTVL
jgi:hypothetical protein